MEDNLEREKKVRGDVEKAKRKLEQDLKATQGTVEELERMKAEMENTIKKWVNNNSMICFTILSKLQWNTIILVLY